MKTSKYLVILRYPDYASDDWPNDTYTTSVRAASPEEAFVKAKEDLAETRGKDPGDSVPEDSALVVVIKGDPDTWQPGDF